MRSVAALLLMVLAAPAAAQEAETPEALPPGPGRDEVFYACTACHGTAIIRAQGMSRERWDDALDWMVDKHNMPKFAGIERQVILDYLAQAFPPRRRAPANPFLKGN